MMSQMKMNPLSIQHKEWVSLFRQSSVSTGTQSLTFVKKLTAIALSTVTYNRGVFAANQYDDYTLDGHPIKLLRGNYKSKRAFMFTTCIKSSFQAIEKHYMRELTLEISSTDGDIIEFYKLFYTYEGDKGCINFSQGTGRRSQVFRLEDIQENTAKMLRSLTRFTQNLNPLPETYIIQLRITYYDEVTPNMYQPKFFSAGTPKDLDKNLNMNYLGNIKTKHHSLNLESGSMLKCEPNEEQKPTPQPKTVEGNALIQCDEDSVITPSQLKIQHMKFGRFTVTPRAKTVMTSISTRSKTAAAKICSLNAEPSPSTSKASKQVLIKKEMTSKIIQDTTTVSLSSGFVSSKGNEDVYSLSESPEEKVTPAAYSKVNKGGNNSENNQIIECIQVNESNDSLTEIDDDECTEYHHQSPENNLTTDQQVEQINLVSTSEEVNSEQKDEPNKNINFPEKNRELVNNDEGILSPEFGDQYDEDKSSLNSASQQYNNIDRNEEVDAYLPVVCNSGDEPLKNDPVLGEAQSFQASDSFSVLLSSKKLSSEFILSSPPESLPPLQIQDYDTTDQEDNINMDFTPIAKDGFSEDKLEQLDANSSPTSSDHQDEILISPRSIKKEVEDTESQPPGNESHVTSRTTSGKESKCSFSDPMGVCSYDLSLDHIKQELVQESQEKGIDEHYRSETQDVNNNRKYCASSLVQDEDVEMERIKRLKLDHSPGTTSQASYSSFVHTTKETSDEGERNIKIECICEKNFLSEMFECHLCNAYHHVVCYGFLPGSNAPLVGCCYKCASLANSPTLCSDPFLLEIDGNPTLFAVYRQILMCLYQLRLGGKHHITYEIIINLLGQDTSLVNNFMQRLAEEGFVKPSKRKPNEFTIKEKRLQAVINENFKTS